MLNMEIIDYKIQLENFYGPLDLLLHLIKENELDIYNIPIARVSAQYLTYMEMMSKLDINLAGEFLLMASTLMEIKARMLVPAYEEEETEEPEDPRFELIRKLLEYKRYKDISVKVRGLMEIQSKTFPRPYLPPDNKGVENEEVQEIKVELESWQLVKTYARLTKEIVLDIAASILYDDIPIERIIEGILEKLKQKGEVLFRDLIASYRGANSAATLDPASFPRVGLFPAQGREEATVLDKRKNRLNVIRNFLATLELARRQSIEVYQEKDFADIKLKFVPEKPAAETNRICPESLRDSGGEAPKSGLQ
ncbi:MAG: segregation/condensation protein A [Planctomycetota bacterium]